MNFFVRDLEEILIYKEMRAGARNVLKFYIQNMLKLPCFAQNCS